MTNVRNGGCNWSGIKGMRFQPYHVKMFGFFRFCATFVSAQIEMVPQNYQKLESEDHVKLMEKLIEIMEDDDDVQNVWHNWEE